MCFDLQEKPFTLRENLKNYSGYFQETNLFKILKNQVRSPFAWFLKQIVTFAVPFSHLRLFSPNSLVRLYNYNYFHYSLYQA